MKSKNCEHEPVEEVESELEEGAQAFSIGDLLGGQDGGWHPKMYVGLGKETRSLWLVGEIEEEMATAFISQIHELTRESPKDEIVVYVHSPGGCVMSTLAIYDALRCSPCPIVMVAAGSAASGACILMLAGDLRLANPNAEFFWHEAITMVAVDSHENFAKQLAHYKEIMRKIRKIVIDRTGMSKKEYKKKLAGNTNFTFDPSTALSMGWIDSIVEYPEKPRFKSIEALEEYLNANEDE